MINSLHEILLPIFLFFFAHHFCPKFQYLPSGLIDESVIAYEEFALSYNEKHRQPNWVAYELTAEELVQGMKRKNYFSKDMTTTNSATLSDYKYSGYDRGHLCRAMYCKNSQSAYRQSFLLSNISPQIGVNFNRTGGIWHDLEQLEIVFAQEYDKIYSVSGPVFKDNLGAIGENAVTIPGYFYKAILLPNLEAAIGFIIKHEVTNKQPLFFAVSIDSLEAFTSIDFFPALTNLLENTIEKSIDLSYWPTYSARVDKVDKSPKSSTSDSVQCIAMAKSTGNRCRRRTTNINGYCWQHQP